MVLDTFAEPPKPELLTSLSRIIDQLQTTDRDLIEHSLLSLTRLLFNPSYRDQILRRANQLLESCVDTFLGLFPRDPSVERTCEITHLLLCSNVMEIIVSSADFGPRISPKTISLYVHALLPIRRGPPPKYSDPSSTESTRKLAQYMSRHATYILQNPNSLISNRLDRSHLLVAILRECTTLLKSPKPYISFLLKQLAELDKNFGDYLSRKYQDGQEVVMPVNCEVEFENLNLDLLLYEANLTSAEILNQDFSDVYEPKVAQLIEILEHFLNHLIQYAKYTGKTILNHFVLVENLDGSIPFQYVCGQLEAVGELPEGMGVIERFVDGLAQLGAHQAAEEALGPAIDGILPEDGRGGRLIGMAADGDLLEDVEEEDDDDLADDDPGMDVLWEMVMANNPHLGQGQVAAAAAAAVAAVEAAIQHEHQELMLNQDYDYDDQFQRPSTSRG